jgi:glucokinase
MGGSGRGPAAAIVVGIDIGGTGTRFVAADRSTLEVTSRLTVPTPSSGSPEEIAQFLREQIEHLAGGRRPVGIGVGASGPVDLDGAIRNPDTLPAFTGLPILAMLGGLTDGPVVIDNDAVCAAIAEHAVGAARGSSRSLHLTLGTGVGVCLLEGDVPFRLHDGTHPEGGHISVGVVGQTCYCGRASCWEPAASRRALQRAAAEVLGRAPDRTVILELATRASAGDAVALGVFDNYGRAIAEGLGTLLTLHGPEIVVIGGSAAGHLGLYANSITRSLDGLGGWIPKHQVVRTVLDDYGGAIGAAYLASGGVTVAGAGSTRPGPTRNKFSYGSP